MKNILIATGLFLLQMNMTGQEQIHYQAIKGDIEITGTSSMHDWEMEVLTASGQITATQTQGTLSDITRVDMTIASSSIVSGNNIMDKKTSKALNAETYPEITFSSEEVKSLHISEQKFSGIATGVLEVAGIKREVEIQFSGSFGPGSLKITGLHSLKMSDFKIAPPTAMMGALKTGDEITIKFNTEWNSRDSHQTAL